MRLGIRGTQIAGVTAIVAAAVVGLSALYAARLSDLVLQEHFARGQLVANAILHRAREVVRDTDDPYAALGTDPGLRASLQSSLYSESVIVAAIVDRDGVVVASNDPTLVGRSMPARRPLRSLVTDNLWNQLRVIYSEDGETFEVREPLLRAGEAIGHARVVVSTVLVRGVLNASLGPALVLATVAIVIAVFVAALLAQVLLRPIHVIRSGLTRLGRGEFGVRLDLPPGDEFGELGSFFNEVSQQLADKNSDVADTHSDVGRGPRSGPAEAQTPVEQLESTLAYSRKLVALGRLTAGIAHEVKNPLNAIVIHLELLRTKIRALSASPEPVQGVLQHVEVIEKEIRRLDEVVQGFLKFTRPEDLKLQPVRVATLLEEIESVVSPEAERSTVRVVRECQASVPEVHGDAAMLRQVFLNLAINAIQAMPDGGTLRLTCAPASAGRVEVRIEDTGLGIKPEHLGRIFDLYFTTKDRGTGIGLSMVFRIVQLHDGEIDVESTPGRGTTFRVLLPRASETR